ncbi:type II toxin-antitoxin system VapB family antitoxin [Streptosporangium sp. NPDC048047]|uniref:type II toxin-antitoxin system VapB family antitoxin n=1 Tax=Streptosporangium sp. NPDC048047 TaxID=3155748 RepID=UPI0034280153
MAVTRIDIDDEVLAEAMRMLGATTKEEAVNRILREYVARVRRVQALERLSARAARGEFDEAIHARRSVKAAWRDERSP